MTFVLRLLFLACAACTIAVPEGVARDRSGSLQEAIDEVQRETGGRVLAADIVRAGPRELYRIKVLTPDGRVRVITKQSRGGGRR
jgi:uncharacterized membrane protein YkoI